MGTFCFNSSSQLTIKLMWVGAGASDDFASGPRRSADRLVQRRNSGPARMKRVSDLEELSWCSQSRHGGFMRRDDHHPVPG